MKQLAAFSAVVIISLALFCALYRFTYPSLSETELFIKLCPFILGAFFFISIFYLFIRITDRKENKINSIHNIVFTNNQILKQMENELDDLKAAVERDTAVDQSAIILLNGLKQKLDDAIASGDPAQLKALSDQLGSNADALAAAVTANTPAQ